MYVWKFSKLKICSWGYNGKNNKINIFKIRNYNWLKKLNNWVQLIIKKLIWYLKCFLFIIFKGIKLKRWWKDKNSKSKLDYFRYIFFINLIINKEKLKHSEGKDEL